MQKRSKMQKWYYFLYHHAEFYEAGNSSPPGAKKFDIFVRHAFERRVCAINDFAIKALEHRNAYDVIIRKVCSCALNFISMPLDAVVTGCSSTKYGYFASRTTQ